MGVLRFRPRHEAPGAGAAGHRALLRLSLGEWRRRQHGRAVLSHAARSCRADGHAATVLYERTVRSLTAMLRVLVGVLCVLWGATPGFAQDREETWKRCRGNDT